MDDSKKKEKKDTDRAAKKTLTRAAKIKRLSFSFRLKLTRFLFCLFCWFLFLLIFPANQNLGIIKQSTNMDTKHRSHFLCFPLVERAITNKKQSPKNILDNKQKKCVVLSVSAVLLSKQKKRGGREHFRTVSPLFSLSVKRTHHSLSTKAKK